MARTRYQIQDRPTPLLALPAAALRAVLREGYGGGDLRADIMAGLVVGVVALPLSMALAIAVGAAPQHGLYTAIVAGFLVALLGGSRTQVTGPTAAFIVILAPIQARHGMAGLLMAGLMAGFILIVMGLLRLGRLMQFMPHPVTTGFTTGIAVVIAAMQLKDFFGLQLAHTPDDFLGRLAAIAAAWRSFSPWDVLVASLTLAVLALLPRWSKRVPAALVALPLAAITALLINRFVPGADLATVASRFQTVVGEQRVSGIPQLPPLPIWPWAFRAPGEAGAFTLSLAGLRELLPGAFSIAMLGAIESLLSAVVADGMARTRHDPDAELLALGVGNVVAPFLGGIPATGALARTATNIRSGGRSPVAAMTHALVVLVAVIALAPIIGYLPMAGLAALLLLVAYNMSERKHFMHVLRVAPKSDVAILLTCFGLTVLFDMVIAVSVGIVLAALLFMRRMAEVAQVRLIEGDHPSAPTRLPPGVVIYDVSGPLFFGAAQRAMAALGIVDRAHTVVLRLEGVPVMDATGLVALESALAELHKRGCLTVLTGLQPQPRRVLEHAHITDQPGRILIRDDVEAALAAIAPART